MHVFNDTIHIKADLQGSLLSQLIKAAPHSPFSVPIRFSGTSLENKILTADVGTLYHDNQRHSVESIFEYRPRAGSFGDKFVAAMIVPTGIGCSIGGHAGDAAPASRLIGSLCDKLVLHPNVVNASDLNEMPSNSLYVEGSVLTRLLMGTVGLSEPKSNRIMVVMEDYQIDRFASATVNAANAARASYGADIRKVIKLNPGIKMSAEKTNNGIATGRIANLESILSVIEEHSASIDAVAIASVIDLEDPEIFSDYFSSNHSPVNPWGGVEAMLTHALSSLTNVPTAHAPMWESEELFISDPGIVDPRMAAEAVSVAFLHCVLKGLSKSPRIVTDRSHFLQQDVLTVENISCLITPDRCLGLPILAALEQGIPVVAVEENHSCMDFDLTQLQWQPGQFYKAKTYLEAAGIIAALREGVSLECLRRPLDRVPIEVRHNITPT